MVSQNTTNYKSKLDYIFLKTAGEEKCPAFSGKKGIAYLAPLVAASAEYSFLS